MVVRRKLHAITVDIPANRPYDLDALPKPPAWTLDAICPQVDPELFFPEKGGDGGHAAKAVCGRCPVITDCLEFALAYESGVMGIMTSYVFNGVYGGLSAQQRKRIVRARAAA